MAHDGTGEGWDPTAPAQGDARSAGAQEIRDLRKGVGIRLKKEHTTFDAASVGGEHLEGSGRIYYQGSAPTKKPDGVTDLDSDDDGRIWVNTNDDRIYVYDGGSKTWEAVSVGSSVPALTASGSTDIRTSGIKEVSGWTNNTGATVFVIYSATSGSIGNANAEINYSGSWELIQSSFGSPPTIGGSVFVPNGASLRVWLFGLILSARYQTITIS